MTIISLLPLLALCACVSTQTVSEEELLINPPESVRLYMNDGRMILFEDYIHSGRTVVGFGEEHSKMGVMPFSGTVILDEVQRIESVRRDSSTLLLLAGIPVAAVIIWLMSGDSGVMYPTIR